MLAMPHSHWGRFAVGIVIAALAATISLAGVLALRSEGDAAGNATRLALPFQESSTATGAGVTITLRSAAFSGTATLLSVRVDLADEQGTITSLSLPREGLLGGTLPPVGPATGGVLKGTASGELMLRMAPLTTSQSKTVVISAVDVQSLDGSSRRITGNWVLDVAVPANLPDLIRTEPLQGGVSAPAQGIEVTAIGGLRSSTETLVTVHFKSPAGLAMLGQPTVLDRGRTLFGANVDSSSDGTTATFSFPPTPFGAPVSVTFGAFSLASESGSVVIDLARVFADNRISGATGDRGVVSPGAVLSSTRPDVAITSVAFTNTNVKNFEVYLGAPLDPNDPTPVTLFLASGKSIRTSSKGIGYNRDASGAIVGGQTQLIFPAPDPTELRGNVRLDLGAGSQVVNGRWVVTLAAE